jgi:hypothetical protein
MAFMSADTPSNQQTKRHAHLPALVSDYLERALRGPQPGPQRLPIRAKVHWDLPDGRLVYWRGPSTDLRTLEEPFAVAKGAAK